MRRKVNLQNARRARRFHRKRIEKAEVTLTYCRNKLMCMQASSEAAFMQMKRLVPDFGIKPMLTILILSTVFIFVHRASAQVWTKTSAPNKNWTAVASSADGTKLAAAFFSGGIYTSTNSGT